MKLFDKLKAFVYDIHAHHTAEAVATLLLIGILIYWTVCR